MQELGHDLSKEQLNAAHVGLSQGRQREAELADIAYARRTPPKMFTDAEDTAIIGERSFDGDLLPLAAAGGLLASLADDGTIHPARPPPPHIHAAQGATRPAAGGPAVGAATG